MSLKKKLLASGITAILMTGSAWALACDGEHGGWKNKPAHMQQGHGHPGGMMMDRELFKGLDLSRSQRNKIRDIMEKYRGDKSGHREHMEENRAQFMLALLDGANTDELSTLVDQNINNMQRGFKDKLPALQEMIQVLTDEQKNKLRQRLQ